MATLGFFDSWNGPPLWVPQYRWAHIVVVAVAISSFAALCVLTVRRQLMPLQYVVLALLPLFAGLLLSVGLTITVLLHYYGPRGWIGAEPSEPIVFAMLCSVIAVPFSVILLAVFGAAVLIRRPNQAIQPTASPRTAPLSDD